MMNQLKREDSWSTEAVGFIEAWKIPGVAPFALCLFFAKLVAYAFLYWLPFYITHTAIDNFLEGGKCGFFMWHESHDNEQFSNRARNVVHMLLNSEEKLKEEVGCLNEKVDRLQNAHMETVAKVSCLQYDIDRERLEKSSAFVKGVQVGFLLCVVICITCIALSQLV